MSAGKWTMCTHSWMKLESSPPKTFQKPLFLPCKCANVLKDVCTIEQTSLRTFAHKQTSLRTFVQFQWKSLKIAISLRKTRFFGTTYKLLCKTKNLQIVQTSLRTFAYEETSLRTFAQFKKHCFSCGKSNIFQVEITSAILKEVFFDVGQNSRRHFSHLWTLQNAKIYVFP